VTTATRAGVLFVSDTGVSPLQEFSRAHSRVASA
jgi:hypothetical protein